VQGYGSPGPTAKLDTVWLPKRGGDMPSEHINPPQYSAFRIADGGRMLTVIERREKRDSRGRFWSTWFSERAPNGERVEIDHARPATGIDESIA
jgi:hypothetical protein